MRQRDNDAATGHETVNPASIIAVAGLILLAAFVARTPADNDLWGHVRFGSDILDGRPLHEADPYSFTSDQPWINHEWLAEVVMAVAYRVGGGLGLVALKLGLLVSAFYWVSRAIHLQGACPPHTYLLLAVAAISSLARIQTMRPQVFSITATAMLLALLAWRPHSRLLRVAGIAALFAVWANLHGGWLVGLLVLVLWTTGDTVDSRAKPWAVADAAFTMVAAASATLVTPFGLGLWTFLSRTVGLSRADIYEWQSVLTFPIVLVSWLPPGLLALWASRRQNKTKPTVPLIVAVLGALSFKVGRLDVFYGMATVVAVAPTFGGSILRPAAPAGFRLASAGVLAATLAYSAFASRCLPIPEYVPEADSVAFIRSASLRGRIFTDFAYGEFAIWHLFPELRVSYDGRRETVYSDEFIQKYNRFKAGLDAGLPRRLAADYAWLPRDSVGAESLRSAGWTTVFSGPRSVILSPIPWQRPAAAQGPVLGRLTGCFPGP